MFHQPIFFVAAGAALASIVSANVVVNNWCTDADATVLFSQNAGCDTGVDGTCGSAPFDIPTGGGTMAWDFIGGGASVSIKVGKVGQPGVIQIEYALTDNIYWDLSDIDGASPGLSGSPYFSQPVQLTPNGNGAGVGTCVQLTCRPNEICYDAYQNGDDADTRTCPLDTGSLVLDLCSPNVQKREESIHVSSAVKRKLASRELLTAGQ